MTGAPGRILVRLPNWLGDVVMSRPCVRALRAAHPQAELRAVVPGALLPIAEWDGVFDRLHAWPAGRGACEALARELRAWRPDAALVLPPSFSSAWWALRCHAPARIGYRGEARDALLTRGLRRPPRGDRHLAEEYLELAAMLGARRVPEVPLPVPEPAREAASALRARHGIPETYAVLGPGAAYGPAKRWAPERFAAVGRALAARGLAVLACGADAERAECVGVAEAIGARGVSLAGATELTTLAALCAAARIAVCNDSGLAHLSAATGTATLVVFGSTSSAWTAPLGARVRVVQHAPVCSPCFQRTCRIGYRCLAAVSAAEVIAACEALAA